MGVVSLQVRGKAQVDRWQTFVTKKPLSRCLTSSEWFLTQQEVHEEYIYTWKVLSVTESVCPALNGCEYSCHSFRSLHLDARGCLPWVLNGGSGFDLKDRSGSTLGSLGDIFGFGGKSDQNWVFLRKIDLKATFSRLWWYCHIIIKLIRLFFIYFAPKFWKNYLVFLENLRILTFLRK